MTSFTEATWRGLKRVLVLTNEDHRGNLFVRNIATITCCSSLSGLSWIWGMSAMEAASHCSMLLSWGSRVTCLGPLPGSLTSEFAMTSTVLGVCTWVLSTQSVPAAQRKKRFTQPSATPFQFSSAPSLEHYVLICSNPGFHSTANTIRGPL